MYNVLYEICCIRCYITWIYNSIAGYISYHTLVLCVCVCYVHLEYIWWNITNLYSNICVYIIVSVIYIASYITLYITYGQLALSALHHSSLLRIAFKTKLHPPRASLVLWRWVYIAFSLDASRVLPVQIQVLQVAGGASEENRCYEVDDYEDGAHVVDEDANAAQDAWHRRLL